MTDTDNSLKEELLEALDDNREIEFELHGHMYFAAPQTDPPLPRCYAIWDVPAQKHIFKGGIEELLSFPFPGGFQLRDYPEHFDILYIY